MMSDPSIVSSSDRVAGKCQACHDCRRRKVRCDYQKPTCSRCEKANIACKGYQRDVIFVNQTPGNLSTTALSVLKQNNLNRHVPRSLDEDLRFLASQVQKPRGSPSQFRLRALEILEKLYLPQSSRTDIRNTSVFSWLPVICELEGESHVLDQSLFAFCVTQVAITKAGNASIDEALHAYNDALQKLLLDIEDDSAGESDEILAAISVLSTCELFLHLTDHGWRAHAQGISEILRIRSGKDSPTPIWHSFCTRIRIILLFESLLKRRASSTIISQCRWLMSTRSKPDSLHDLIDIACEVPVLLEQSDMLIAGSITTPVQGRVNLFQTYLAVLEKFYDYYQRYRAEKASLIYWAVPSTVDNPADEYYESKLFPFALQFESLKIAGELIILWAILFQVLCSMIDLHQHFFGTLSLPSASTQTAPEEATGLGSFFNSRFPTMSSVRKEVDRLSRCLCQSIEYCHKVENGTVGVQFSCYARWILKFYFQKFRCERELAWCLNIKNMRGPGFQNGIDLMGFQD